MDELISKRAVIEAIEKARANVGHNLERSIGKSIIEILDEVGEDVEKLPSAQPKLLQPWEVLVAQAVLPQPKTGKWIEEPNCCFRCSICGEHYPSIRGYMKYRFCPNCGANMEDGEDETD